MRITHIFIFVIEAVVIKEGNVPVPKPFHKSVESDVYTHLTGDKKKEQEAAAQTVRIS